MVMQLDLGSNAGWKHSNETLQQSTFHPTPFNMFDEMLDEILESLSQAFNNKKIIVINHVQKQPPEVFY